MFTLIENINIFWQLETVEFCYSKWFFFAVGIHWKEFIAFNLEELRVLLGVLEFNNLCSGFRFLSVLGIQTCIYLRTWDQGMGIWLPSEVKWSGAGMADGLQGELNVSVQVGLIRSRRKMSRDERWPARG